MAHHKSAIKRIRQTAKRRALNKYRGKTTRNAIRRFYSITEKTEAEKQLPTISSMVDKLAGKNTIHKNKASNIKSKLTRHVQALA